MVQKGPVRQEYESDIKAGKIKPGMNFNERVWALTSRIPEGEVTTYGEIARKMGTKAARAVGNALNRNPYAPEVPCHRVVASNGALTGFATGLAKKERILAKEGVKVSVDHKDAAKKRIVVEYYKFR